MQFPIIRPVMPAVGQWAPFLDESYGARRFSNFGPLVQRLEARLLADWGSPDSACVLVSSGTAAVTAPLIAAGITGPVPLPAFTFPATLAAIRMAGATPVLIDVDPVTWAVTPSALDDALASTAAKAAVLVAPFGLRTDFAPHADVARRRGAILVIDNASGLGVRRAYPETAPHVHEAYSLHATKPFGIGEGGVVFTHRSREHAIRQAINFALAARPGDGPPHWGINGKMAEFQAAIGLAVAEDFATRLNRRRQAASGYAAMMAAFPQVPHRTIPEDAAWQFFPLLLPSGAAADAFQEETRSRGMEIRRYYAPSLSRLEGVECLQPCPVSESLAARMCCVPVYSDATDTEIAEMVDTVAGALGAVLGTG
jgi:dTDP-4-amino-4,6-dideoxygalactose transaminase